MQLNIKITQSGFRLWFWPLTPGAFMSDKLRQLARGVIYGESEKVWKTQHNWHNSLACQRSPVYSAALSAVLTFLLGCIPAYNTCISKHACSQHGGRLHCLVRHQGPQQSLSPCLLPSHPSQPSDWSCQGSLRPRSCSQASFPSDTPTDSSSQVSRAFAILSTSSPVSSVKKSRACKPNYGNSLVVFTTLKNQTSLILTTSLATAKYTTGICLLRALIRASTLSKEIIHAVAATS